MSVGAAFWPLAYRAVTVAGSPLVRRYLERRCREGKEDPRRIPERYGSASAARPAGKLIWIHAASVGEAHSVLALIDRIAGERPGLEMLLTTGTVASARLLAERLPPRVRHQFVPVDLPRAVARFLDHWRPDLAIWVESELWPNLVLATRRRGVPMLLLNGRLSARSVARWRAMPGLIRPLLRAFSLCLTQDDEQARRFRDLGAGGAESVGDLKAAAPPLAADPAALAVLHRQIDARPLWVAASTHQGEEEVVAGAHIRVAELRPSLLTIIAPRHPARGPVIAEELRARGLRVARRGAGEPVVADTEIYLADTLGELGLLYRLTDVAFVGGSLVAKGGHNPFEPARLGCAVLHGPDMSNCAAMAAALEAGGAGLTVSDAETLAGAVARLLDNPAECRARARAAARIAAGGNGALDAVLGRLAPWLDTLAPAVRSDPTAPSKAPLVEAVREDARA